MAVEMRCMECADMGPRFPGPGTGLARPRQETGLPFDVDGEIVATDGWSDLCVRSCLARFGVPGDT